ncbi:GRB10-interacting GYF protein 2-like [Mauremys reevesii]|uniref:GRB10-interacting GYF protein 2-like n=1 Tax=Mauremys reevesii TaxID=260615 RepID=UPI00193F60F3|nr:GRB10-interacting GYF protein 2-like [Mauremys reevesii]
MALSTCSGRDEGYKLVVQDRFEAGMRELVCFTQHLLEAEADPHAHEKIRERIEAASREMSAAEEELGRRLETVDSRTEELVVKKKSLQDEQEEKKENLKCLRIQLDSCHRSEREAREMLDGANRHLREMQAELQRRRADADSNRVIRDIGIGLMFIPLLGTIAGSIMVGCGQVALDAAEKAAREAQEAVNRHRNEASSYLAEVSRYEEQERQVEAEITANEQQLAQIDADLQALAVLQGEIVTLQDGLRKCTTLVNGLAGKVCVAKRLTEDLVIYEELANILGEVVQQVLPLMSPGGEAGTRFLAAGELQGLIEKLESGGSSLRALADTEAAAIEF